MSRRFQHSIFAADLLWIPISLLGAYAIRYQIVIAPGDPVADWRDYLLFGIVALIVWSVLHSVMKLDGFSNGWNPPRILSQVFIGVLLLMAILLSVAFLARHFYSRLLLFYFGSLVLAGFLMIRYLMRSYVLSRARRGTLRRVAVLGNGRIARELVDNIERHPEMMKKVVGYIYPSRSDQPTGSPDQDAPFTGSSTNTIGVVELLKSQRIDEIIVVHPQASVSELQKIIESCRAARICVSLVPQWYELYMFKTRFLDVDGLPLISLEQQSPRVGLLAAKRITDLLLASTLLLVSAPIVIVAVLLLVLKRERPFRGEQRCGLEGRPFFMWRLNIDRHLSSGAGLRGWLARLSLTELPQLWNVICGDMTLVGPRPEPVERVKHYSDWQRQRLRMKPGLTGLAQVHGLREQHSSDEKANFDLQYILHWSPLIDLSLLVQTVWTVTVRLWSSNTADVYATRTQVPNLLNPEVVNADRSHAGAD
jgi:lipopolysaccharide/colanic/teichoic acid biosynthesis glycosyltransferase